LSHTLQFAERQPCERFLHPSLPGLTRQSIALDHDACFLMDARVNPRDRLE
jgi:hypothetical protein